MPQIKTHWQVKVNTCSHIPRDKHSPELVPNNFYAHTEVYLSYT